MSFIIIKAATSTSHAETPSTSGSSSKEGKKRAVDDDAEATASDEEGPGTSKGSKRRKTQVK